MGFYDFRVFGVVLGVLGVFRGFRGLRGFGVLGSRMSRGSERQLHSGHRVRLLDLGGRKNAPLKSPPRPSRSGPKYTGAELLNWLSS